VIAPLLAHICGSLCPHSSTHTHPLVLRAKRVLLYKDKYRFWTGFLLLIRCILFVTFAVNILGAPGVNLLAIGVTCMCVLPLIHGVYRKWPLGILEFLSIFNLGTFSLATAYVLNNGGSQIAVAGISTAFAFVTFVGVLVWHAYNEMRVLGMYEKCTDLIQRVRGREILQNPVQLDYENLDNEEAEEVDYREPLLAYEDT